MIDPDWLVDAYANSGPFSRAGRTLPGRSPRLLSHKFHAASISGTSIRCDGCCCSLIPLAVSIDHASGKIAVKRVQKGIEAEIAVLDGVAFRQRADGEMFVNFASALDLPANSANASLLDISHNTKVS